MVFHSLVKTRIYYRKQNSTFTIEHKTALLLSNKKQHFYYRVCCFRKYILKIIENKTLLLLSNTKPNFFHDLIKEIYYRIKTALLLSNNKNPLSLSSKKAHFSYRLMKKYIIE